MNTLNLTKVLEVLMYHPNIVAQQNLYQDLNAVVYASGVVTVFAPTMVQ
jgi:hypothetical protein